MPPSSASFHYYENESIAKLNNLVETNRRLVDELNRANNTLDHIVSRTNELETRVQVLQQQLSNYSLALLNGGGGREATFETRCKLFHDLPEATGQMRRSQQVTAKLMAALNKILSDNNLEY